MSRVTTSAEIKLDDLTDAPDEEWLRQIVEQYNEFARQTVSFVNQNSPGLDCSNSTLKTFDMVHGTELTIANPLDVPIEAIRVVSCVGLTTNSDGSLTRGVYNLAFPNIEWHNSTESDGSVVITAYFPTDGQSTGYAGEQISSAKASASAVSLTSNTVASVTSISLTPGVWDITSICGFNGAPTATRFEQGISTSDTAFQGNAADQRANIPGPAPTGSSGLNDLVVPDFRVTLTAATTYYLDALAVFSAGSTGAFGRITATRSIPYMTGTTGRVGLLFQGVQ